MKIVGKIIMFIMAVSDMKKMKEFCVDKLGLKITKDLRQDDSHWWVSLELPEGGTSITLTTFHGNMKPGIMTLYLSTPDIKATYEELIRKGAKPTKIENDLYGPGSGVKWFSIIDPDGNNWLIVQS